MENSSKALLIAAAVLIVIILIALGVKIFNSSGNADKQAQSVGESISSATKDAAERFESSFDIDRESASSGSSGLGGEIADIPTQGKENITQEESSIATTTLDGVPIPKEFKYVEGTKDTGVVIEHETEGSQFVWVPVTKAIATYGLGTSGYREPDVLSGTNYDAVEANLRRAGCTEDLNNDNVVNAYDFKVQLTNEFDKMAASLNKYGGFYVGRYQVSRDGKSKANKFSAHASDYTWYGLYALCKTYNTSSVQSSMIWGSQYDAMMEWIGDAANNKKGNNRNKTTYTGNVQADKINNIYDLYGGLYEWTLEAYGNGYRSYRGGNYERDYSPAKKGSQPPTSNYSDRGSRLAIYIL